MRHFSQPENTLANGPKPEEVSHLLHGQFMVVRGWFGWRWHVYERDGAESVWLASFRDAPTAVWFAGLVDCGASRSEVGFLARAALVIAMVLFVLVVGLALGYQFY